MFDFVIEWLVQLVFPLVVIVHFVVFDWTMMLPLSGTRVPNLGPLQQKHHQLVSVWRWCLVVVVDVMTFESRVTNLALLDVMVVVIVVVMEYVVVPVHFPRTMMMKSLRRTMMN